MSMTSIRARMTLGLTLFIAVLASSGGLGLWLQARHDFYERDQRTLRSTAAKIRSELGKGTQWNEIGQIVRESNSSEPGDVEVWLIGTNGKETSHIFSHVPPPFSRPLPERPFPESPPPGRPDDRPEPPPSGFPTVEQEHASQKADELSRRGILPPNEDPSGWFIERIPYGKNTIVVGVPWHKSRRALYNQGVALIVMSAFVTLASGLGAWVLVGRTLFPIKQLAAQARQQAQQQSGQESNFIALHAPSSDAEVQELVATFNALLDNVAQTMRIREQFHAAASHELRTPLQALSGTLQLALSRPRDNDGYRTALQEASSQSSRLNALTRDLLLLNQLGNHSAALNRETVSIAEACDLAISGLERAIATKEIQLEESLLSSEIEASPAHVEMLTRNLLENAVKYAPQQGKVSVHVEPTEPRLTIWNESTTRSASQDAEDLSAWFEPFYRPDASRTSSTGGNGLGLAICKAICQANGWNIELRRHNEGIEAHVFFTPAS